MPLLGKQTGQADLNGMALHNTLLPLSPRPEQRRSVAKVDELMTPCDRLEASLAARDTARSRLLNALLAEALAPAAVPERQAAE